jgi:hypothetical protein
MHTHQQQHCKQHKATDQSPPVQHACINIIITLWCKLLTALLLLLLSSALTSFNILCSCMPRSYRCDSGDYEVWPSTPKGQNYIRSVYKKCSKWILLPTATTMMKPG